MRTVRHFHGEGRGGWQTKLSEMGYWIDDMMIEGWSKGDVLGSFFFPLTRDFDEMGFHVDD